MGIGLFPEEEMEMKKKMMKKRFVFLLSTKKKKKKTSMMMERCSLVLPSQSSWLPSQTLVAVGGDPALVHDVDTFFCPHLF